MDLPWWTLSPSPFTILFYLLLIGYTMRQLKCRTLTKRFTDSFFLVGFTILFLDSFWILACLLRFGALYPNSLIQLLAALGRNITGLIFCYLFIGPYFKTIFKPNKKTLIMFLVDLCFLSSWFLLAPSPAYTDWTYAIKKSYNFSIIITSFFISHILGKTIAGTFFWTLWN